MDPFSDDEGDSLLNNQLDEHALTEEEAVASKFCRLYDLVCAPTTKTGKMELSKIKLTSDVYLIKSRNPVWKSYTLELCGDILFITQVSLHTAPSLTRSMAKIRLPTRYVGITPRLSKKRTA